jgi:predicted phage terminase large subunit-like protein
MRLDDKRTGASIVVMQRVHMDDLTGYLTEQSNDWELLNLPAIAEADEAVPCWQGELYHRKIGEALSPEREPRDVLDRLKMQIGSDAFSAQYQQMPVPPGGAMIKRHWVQRYQVLPPRYERSMVLQSWDTANKGGPQNDWSVCTTWIIAKAKWYLVDLWRGRVDYPALKAMVIRQAEAQQPNRILLEDAGAGTSLAQELKSSVPGIIPVQPVGDKINRMATASAKFEAGQVLLPEKAGWLPDLEAELFAFPGAKHDDQCDSISQALNFQISWIYQLSPERWQELLAQASVPRRGVHWYR